MNSTRLFLWPASDAIAAVRQPSAAASSRSVLQLVVLGVALLFVAAGNADALMHDRLPENVLVRSAALPWQTGEADSFKMRMQEDACPLPPPALEQTDAGASE